MNIRYSKYGQQTVKGILVTLIGSIVFFVMTSPVSAQWRPDRAGEYSGTSNITAVAVNAQKKAIETDQWIPASSPCGANNTVAILNNDTEGKAKFAVALAAYLSKRPVFMSVTCNAALQEYAVTLITSR